MSRNRKFGAGVAIAALAAASIFASSASASAAAPANDSYSHATVVPAGGSGYFVGLNNSEATLEKGEISTFTSTAFKHIWNTVWAKWTAPASGVIEADTNGSDDSLDTTLAIYTSASSLSKAKRLAWNDDSTYLAKPKWSEIPSLAVAKGTTYYFQVGSASGTTAPAVGSVYVNISPSWSAPSNDNLGNAITESGSSFAVTGADYGASLESWEQSDGLNSIWYKWTPTSMGSVAANTNGSAVDTYLSVWELRTGGDTPSGDLVKVAADDSSGTNNNASLTLPALRPGSSYYFQVGSDNSPVGSVKLSVSETVTGPAITKISASSGTVKGGTKITITGARLTNVNEVDFGALSTNGSKIVHSGSTKLTVVTPAVLNKGKVYVQLDTSTGLQSVVNSHSYYTYK